MLDDNFKKTAPTNKKEKNTKYETPHPQKQIQSDVSKIQKKKHSV